MNKIQKLTGIAIAAAAAGVFSTVTVGSAFAADEAKVHCAGVNACKGQNDCKGQGACKTDKNACKGQNGCKGQGGCKSGDAGCSGKNSCKGKGGCAVPAKKKAADKAAPAKS